MNRESEGKSSGIPHLAKNERDMGHPSLVREPEGRAGSARRQFSPSGTTPHYGSFSTAPGRDLRPRRRSLTTLHDRGIQRKPVLGICPGHRHNTSSTSGGPALPVSAKSAA